MLRWILSFRKYLPTMWFKCLSHMRRI